MEKQIKLKFKIGNFVEFEAEGTTEDVEKQRASFMETVFPSAVEAFRHENTQQSIATISDNASSIELLPETSDVSTSNQASIDFSRTSLSSFIKKYGDINDQDFVLFAAYFDEQRNNKKEFNLESIRQYYIDARRSFYSNNSMLIKRLIQKGYIMDAVSQDDNDSKYFMLTNEGLEYIENFKPKENIGEKRVKKFSKTTSKVESQYTGLISDELNLNNYPKVKDQKVAINQLVLALYIITKENKGEWFSYTDIQHIYTYIFEIPFNINTIKSAINKHKSWFVTKPDDNNKKTSQYKLLNGAKDAAESIINGII